MIWYAFVCLTCLSAAEGMSTTPYFDAGGRLTVCFGETANVRLGDRYTVNQCTQKLMDRIRDHFGPAVDRCVKLRLPPERKVAYVGLAYNVGITAFCKSTLVKKENAGDPAGACNELLKWNKVRVAGILVAARGLTSRRAEERKLCLEGLV